MPLSSGIVIDMTSKASISNGIPMKKIVKVLSHKDRILGRIISGGSQISLKHEIGKALVNEIKNGFFEKKTVNNTVVARQLHLPFTLFHTFRKTQLN